MPLSRSMRGRSHPGRVAWPGLSIPMPRGSLGCALALTLSAVTGFPAVPAGLSQLKAPVIVSHRGSPLQFVEHTLEAYRRTLEQGSPFVEVDCFLLADGTLGVMHDETLDRTTTASGPTAAQSLESWQKLQLKRLPGLGGGDGNHPPLVLEEVLKEFANRAILFVEAKNKGAGAAIVDRLRRFGVQPDFVVVNSFDAQELAPALAAGYPCALAMFHEKAAPEPAELKRRGYRFVMLWSGFSEDYFLKARLVGLDILAYPVNRHDGLAKALGKGAVGVVSDEPAYLDLRRPRQTQDPFGLQHYAPGQLPLFGEDRGTFVAPEAWRLDRSRGRGYAACLQGWCSPLNQGKPYAQMGVRLAVSVAHQQQARQWVSVLFTSDDRERSSVNDRADPIEGIECRISADGRLVIEHLAGGSRTVLAQKSGRPFPVDQVVPLGVTYARGRLEWWRLDTREQVDAMLKSPPGHFISLGASEVRADFSQLRVYAY